MTLRCAIYCTVIDNFGDVGVCWRLARQLADEYAVEVTLWVDDLVSFAKLAPDLDSSKNHQTLGKVTVCLWQAGSTLLDEEPFDLVIEGFGCRLPDTVLTQMVKQTAKGQPTFWINLEYLSAESWVADCHAMPSIHPQTGLVQYFWFPSFTAQSGGLLRESKFIAERDAFQQSITAQNDFWAKLHLTNATSFQQLISLFSYENAAIPALLDSLANDTSKTLLVVPEGKVLKTIRHWSNQPLQINERLTQGHLTIAVLPLLSHEDYDRLLWSCDLNIVRGEDSFIRAQWAGKPLLWHIYPQAEDVHLLKLNAFIETVVSQTEVPASWRAAMLMWNHNDNTLSFEPQKIWSDLLAELPAWHHMTQRWSTHLTKQPDLAAKLMQFYTQIYNQKAAQSRIAHK